MYCLVEESLGTVKMNADGTLITNLTCASKLIRPRVFTVGTRHMCLVVEESPGTVKMNADGTLVTR